MRHLNMVRKTRNQALDLPAMKIALQLCVAILSSSSVLPAQTNTENGPGIQFNFVVPGARSLALGSAFLARADDATAAYTNPAGLTTLSRPEISIEGRSWSFKHVFTDGGRVDGVEPTGIGIDTISGLQAGEAENRVEGLSFLSFVYPASKRWRLAFYRHELANFEARFETQGSFLNFDRGRNRPTRVAADLYIVNYGVSVAVVALGDVYEPKLSLGIGLSYYDFSMDFVARRYHLTSFGSDLGGRFGEPLYSDNNLQAEQIQRGGDADLGVNIGFLWKVTQRWDVGGVYRQGPDFDLNAKQEGGPQADPGLQYPTDELAKFHVPDVYGFGLAFAPTQYLKFSFDYRRVEYSRLTDDMVDIYSFPLLIFRGQNLILDPELERFKVDDADEFHVGFEYIFFWGEGSRSPLALRLGAWIDPDHAIRFEGECETRDFGEFLAPIIQEIQCYRFQSLFQHGEDEIHYSAGFGIAEIAIGARMKFQIDLAFDHSERVDTAAISAVFRFGK